MPGTAVCSAAIVTGPSVGWRWSAHGADAAHEVLLRGARVAADRGAHALEAMLLHDVARFGGATKVAERLVELASSVQGPLATARAHHAAGVAGADLTRLQRAVDEFEDLRSPLLAAEAALDLADAALDAAGADAARDRATRLIASFDQPVVTPRLSRRG